MFLSTKAVVSYCALVMAIAMMQSAFNFYYVKVFLDKYYIQEYWFHVSQILYLIWNAVNDPLFAVLQDNTSFLLTRTRREGILYVSPLMALSFLIPWFQWGFGDGPWAVGIHLIVSLFLYDTMFTFVGLLSCCLFAELSTDPSTRLKLTRYSMVASLLGAQSIFVLEYMSDSLRDFAGFQKAAVGIACCSVVLMNFTGRYAHTQYDLRSQQRKSEKSGEEKGEPSPPPHGGKHGTEQVKEDSSFRKMLQILTDKNFIAFATTNFFQEFHRAFLVGFTAIFCEYLVRTAQVSAGVRSFFYGITGICGQLLVIVVTPLVGYYGYFRAIRFSFAWKVVAGLVMYLLIGPSSPWLVMVFILLDTAFTSGTFSLFNMPMSDIADSDKEKYNRRHPITSTVFGSNALIVKPSQSLCPMIVVRLLNLYSYERVKVGLATPAEVCGITTVMFQLVCLCPVVLGLVQCVTWSQFNIRKHNSERVVVPREVVFMNPPLLPQTENLRH